MFERFTHAARDIVARAQYESDTLGHDHIGREHLLLGLAGADDPLVREVLRTIGVREDALRAAIQSGLPDVDADALASIGIDLDAVRRSVEESFGPGALGRRDCRRARRTGHKPFTPGAKRTLERSLREALALGNRHIGAEHVLLALGREREGGAAALLRRCGSGPDALRAATLRALRDAA
jgi:ATP-dependent Clp protease ATP-binding subunit ClpA